MRIPNNRNEHTLSRGIVSVGLTCLLSLCATSGFAQDWAKAMFDNKTTHDFGVVARGAKVEHHFVIENIYEEDVHIASVSSSCGCSTPRATKQSLKTWEKAEIVVTLDTRGFLGRKDATITVVFDKPTAAEVQLHVHAYIRSDIVVQPGAAELGSVSQGAGASQTLTVSYAGRDDWRIEKVECANPSIEAKAVETSRSPGLVNYSLAVKLKADAPAGYIHDQLVLVTNDADIRSARVPVAVEGLVAPAVTVRPSPLLMTVGDSPQPLTRNLVVQGRTPFHIVAVHPSDERFQCRVPNEAKSVHILPVTFTAKGNPPADGKLDGRIRIETDSVGVIEANVSVRFARAGSVGH